MQAVGYAVKLSCSHLPHKHPPSANQTNPDAENPQKAKNTGSCREIAGKGAKGRQYRDDAKQRDYLANVF